jgi:prolyl-tRNA editing enzyme YbaK/EbsC (Cys-tRNA(Pro) deacylase)
VTELIDGELTDLPRSTQKVINVADAIGLPITVRFFDEPTHTADEAAAAVGVDVGQIVKSLVFAVGDTLSEPGEVVLALVRQILMGPISAALRVPPGVLFRSGKPHSSTCIQRCWAPSPLRFESHQGCFFEAASRIRAPASGSNQLDEKKLARAAGAKKAWRIDANRVRTVTGFVIGGIPPFAHDTALRTFADEDLLQYDVVWAAAGTSNHNFAASPAQLVQSIGAAVGDLAKRPT